MNNITVIKDCKYRLPCGWCDRKNEICQFEAQAETIIVDKLPEEVATTEYVLSNKVCTEHEWVFTGADTHGWTYSCRKCHASKRENYSDMHTPSITPKWINPDAPSVDKIGDFPPYNYVTCTSGYVNTDECPEKMLDSILSTNVTTSAQTEAQAFVNEVKSGKLPKMKEKKNER